MIIKNEYHEYVILSIDYIRLFGKDNYIKLYKKIFLNNTKNVYDILDIDIPIEGYEYLRVQFINTSTNEVNHFTHTLDISHYKLEENGQLFIKTLKRLIKIHKLNND